MAEEKVTPVGKNVLIEYEAFRETVTASGLYLAKPKHEGLPEKGKVFAVGDQVEDIAVGDYVIFKYDMNKGFKHKDLKLIVVPADSIVAKITKE